MACEKCAALCVEYEIRSPYDLAKTFAVVQGNITDGTIQEVSGSESYIEAAQALAQGKSWPADYLSYKFACTNCGQQFNLNAETYHGGGGAWRQAAVP